MNRAFINGHIYRSRNLFCEAILTAEDRILAVGSTAEILERAPAGTERIDLQGKTVLPGFYDCHIHLNGIGRIAQTIDARDVTSIDELVERGRALIEALKPPPGSLISGRGFNQENFIGDKRYPNRYDLDRISQEHRITISRVCGHVVVCNSAMLEAAGISEEAPDIEGGQVDTDQTGKPLGILRERATSLVRRFNPPPTTEENYTYLRNAMREAVANGLTSVAAFDVQAQNFQEITGVFRRIYQEEGASLRVTLQCGIGGNDKSLEDLIAGTYRSGDFILEPYLKMGPLKLFADGSLGSHTAWVRKPYQDNPGVTGMPVAPQSVLEKVIQKAHENQLQVIVHAIGDAGIEAVVQSYESITSEGSNPLRHGVLHCQITDLPLLERMAQRDILALIQPIFLTHDMYFVESRVGPELASTSYAWGTMEKLGIRCAYGTDSPVESPNPLHGIACAIARKDVYGDFSGDGFYPQECVDIYTAVDAYTIGTAYANFDENRVGRLEAGYLADLIVLDKDIFTLPPEGILSTRVLLTVIGGQTVYGSL